MYRQAWTDRLIGSGLVLTLRAHSVSNQQPDQVGWANRTQMYVFAYQSKSDPWTKVLGSYFGSHLIHVFGLPRLVLFANWSQLGRDWPNNLGLNLPYSKFTKLDLNMTDYWLSFVTNFVKNQNATPIAIRNLTWDSYRPNNRTYLWLNLTENYNQSLSHQGRSINLFGIDLGFDLKQNYRVIKHAYWNNLYLHQLKWYPRVQWPEPIPSHLLIYQTISIFLVGVIIIILILILALFIVYQRQRRLMKS